MPSKPCEEANNDEAERIFRVPSFSWDLDVSRWFWCCFVSVCARLVKVCLRAFEVGAKFYLLWGFASVMRNRSRSLLLAQVRNM